MDTANEQIRDDRWRGKVRRADGPHGFRRLLRASREVFDQLRDPIITLDSEYRITDCNPAAEALYGFRAAEVRGVAFGDATGCAWPPERDADGGEPSLLDEDGVWSGRIM